MRGVMGLVALLAVGLAGCASVPQVCFEEETRITVIVQDEPGPRPVPAEYVHKACVGPKR